MSLDTFLVGLGEMKRRIYSQYLLQIHLLAVKYPAYRYQDPYHKLDTLSNRKVLTIFNSSIR